MFLTCAYDTCAYLCACLVVAAVLQVVDVAVGCGTCYALTDDGDVYAWGAGSKGQLGRGEAWGDRCCCCIRRHVVALY
jgi:hypothetical protein